MMKLKNVLLAFAVATAMAGCDDDNTTSTTTSTTTATKLTGVFLDSAVGGLTYKSSACTINCVTNAKGEFDYQDGDEVEFMIGDLSLGKVKGAAKVYPNDVTGESNLFGERAVRVARLLQTLDADGDPSNGITIKDVSVELNACGFDSEAKLAACAPKKDGKALTLVAETDAVKHLNSTLESEGKVVGVKFTGIDMPTGSAKESLQATTAVKVGGTDQKIAYTKLIATGEKGNGEIYGASKDYLGNTINFTDGSPYVCNGTNAGVGSGLDFVSILQKNSKLYMVSQFECQVGSLYMSELDQDSTTGALSVKKDTLKFINQASEFGGYVHCAGQTTPWQSHLASEEYEPDARAVEKKANPTTGLTGNKYYDEVAKFWNNDIKQASPYFYGWTPEVQIDSAGDPKYTKHYSMGRFSHELSYVMPDNKTVYMSDDGTNVGMFMFIADKAEDLSAGTLYALKWTQTSEAGKGMGEADITWVNLGHARNSEIRPYVAKKMAFSSIFDTVDPVDGSCTSGYTSVNTTPGHECLKLKDVDGSGAVDAMDEKIASRLETRRFAAYKGATTEFRKEEGVTFNTRDSKLYIAMSAVERGMENNQKGGKDNTQYDVGGNNDIKVAYNTCGAIYELDVKGSQKDTAGTAIASDLVAVNMKGILEGEPSSAVTNNSCHVDKIANPDNVAFLEGSNILTIGEDTSKHENNIIWAYDIKSGDLTRTVATPLDAETTSPFWYKNINGFGYMTAVTQHPMGDRIATEAQKQSEAGYLGVFDFSKLK